MCRNIWETVQFMGENNDLTTNGLEFENFKIPIPLKRKAGEHEEIVSFSIKLVELLDSKAKKFDSLSGKGCVNLNDLKRVYIKGAGDCSLAKGSDKTCGEWALARVNMFLRQKLGGKMIVTAAELKSTMQFDISETWVPSEEDYIQAQADIQEYELNYNFENVEELYIEPYEKLEIEW